MLFGWKKQCTDQVEMPEESTEKIDENEIEEEQPETLPAAIDKTVIGEGVTFEGNFEAKEEIELNGSIRGDMTSTAAVKVSRLGFYKGSAKVKSIVLDGSVEGQVSCSESARFSASGRMKGILSTPAFTPAEGADFEGSLYLGASKKA